ncbi:MAG TPA: hypothetical protein VHB74_01650 [Devosia sp.]|nr:hypothetical protein [Devosia sp.]
MTSFRALAISAFGAALILATAVMPAEAARLRIWDLKLGTTVDKMPPWIAFKGYACGSNGGPPLQQLSGWADYKKCAAEPNGLHEVYFEYDDEDEYIARAHEDLRVARDVGTVDKSFPIIASALFDDAGVLKGLRIVTDPRQNEKPDNDWVDLRGRDEHYLLGSYLSSQFHMDPEKDCTQQPLGPGESKVGSVYVKLDCQKLYPADNARYLVSVRFYRKKGQAARDPHTGALTQGQFVSLTKAEIFMPDVPLTAADSPDGSADATTPIAPETVKGPRQPD